MKAVDVSIEINKRIPVCAGLGGGSADAAAVLHGLNAALGIGLKADKLARLGAELGADVPFCVLGGTYLASGRGDELQKLAPLPDCGFVICKPRVSLSTGEMFSRIRCTEIKMRPDTTNMISALEQGDLLGVAARVYNVFEDFLPAGAAEDIIGIKAALIENGALGAAMSGSGSAVFGIFRAEEDARKAAERLKETWHDVFVAAPVRN